MSLRRGSSTRAARAAGGGVGSLGANGEGFLFEDEGNASGSGSTNDEDSSPAAADGEEAEEGEGKLRWWDRKDGRRATIGEMMTGITTTNNRANEREQLYYEVINASLTRRRPRSLNSSSVAAAASMCPQVPALGNRAPQLLSGSSGNNNSTSVIALPSTQINTTLVFQCSVNRIFLLNETCRRWRDPIVAVVTVDSGNSYNQLAYLNANLARWKPDCPHLRVMVYYLDDNLDIGSNLHERYPINQLRNIGLDHVKTSHALVADVDFIPSVGFDETIRKAITQEKGLRSDEAGSNIVEGPSAPGTWKVGWIVPVFERIADCNNDAQCQAFMRQASEEEGNGPFIPRTFKELQACNQRQQCQVFNMEHNPLGHLSSRQDLWLQENWYTNEYGSRDSDGDDDGLQQSIIKRARSIPCIHSDKYEPYIVLEWCVSGIRGRYSRSSADAAPYYDERFYGYGKNKVQYMSHLRYMGYQLRVLPEGFLVHHPHPISAAKQLWRNKSKSRLRALMDNLYLQFLKELEQRYLPDNAGRIIPMCNMTEAI